MRRSRFHYAAIVLLAVTGCFGRDPSPDFALIYNQSAQHHGPDRNPIVVIPGILGSRLTDRAGSTVWGAFEPPFADPSTPEGARQIALPIRDVPLREARDDIEVSGVLDKVRFRLLGLPVEVPAYAGILATLGAGGYRDRALGTGGEIDYGDNHFTCFQYGYDWRRDNVESAQRLYAYLSETADYVRQQYRERFDLEVEDIKFDIVAHSMGGLVVRYMMMYGDADLPANGSLPALTWKGARHVERVILVGTPNAGSAESFLDLIEGEKIAPLLPFYPPSVIGSFPSVYQLLPRARHRAVVWDGDPQRPVEIFDPTTWTSMQWGLSAPDQDPVLARLMPEIPDASERRRIAVAAQARLLSRAEHFHRAVDRPATPPAGVELFLIAGDASNTVKTISVDSRTGETSITEHAPGDGTVLRSSVLMDERAGGTWQPELATPIAFRAAMLLPAKHLALTTSEVFRDNVLFWLLEKPREPAGD